MLDEEVKNNQKQYTSSINFFHENIFRLQIEQYLKT